MKKSVLTFILIPFLLFYALPAGAVEKEERKWQDETIYFLMIDRFNNGDDSNDFKVDVKDPKAFHGGDFQGVIERLDYIKDMGFTSIGLSPVFDNGEMGYHGYWVNDFYKTEEHFGSLDKFKELVNEAHKRDMKVIVDFVVNHVGKDHPWVDDPEKAEMFHENMEISNTENKQELENGWVDGLPDLNQENPEVRDYLIDAAKWWIEKTDIDGYRLDSVNYVPMSFWTDFTKEVKGVKNDFYLLGEVKSNDPAYIAQYEETGIDGFINYSPNEELRNVFAKVDQPLGGVFEEWEKSKSIYEDPYLLGTFMDNHDTVRFTRDATSQNQHPGPRWRLALTYLYTVPGIPMVYYGSEIALDGGESPDNRKLMNFRTDKELVDYITKIGEVRNRMPSLTRGTMELLHEEEGIAVYKREYQNETAVIAINNTSKSHTITLDSEQLEKNKELRGLLTDDLVRSTDDDKYPIIIDREEAEIYVLSEKSGMNFTHIAAVAAVFIAFGIFILILKKRARRINPE